MAGNAERTTLIAIASAIGLGVAQPVFAEDGGWTRVADDRRIGATLNFSGVFGQPEALQAEKLATPISFGLFDGTGRTWTPISQTQEFIEEDKDAEDVFSDASEAARKTSNPLGGDFMVMINEWHYNWLDSDIPGVGGKNSLTHIFQPVMPFSLEEEIGENWIIVNRPTLAIIYDADVPSGFGPGGIEFGSESGLGDISHFTLVGTSVPSSNSLLGDGDRVLAGGFSLNIPSGTNGFSNNAWAAGPAAVAAFIGEKGILGVLGQTQFDFASSGGGDTDYDVAFVQPFYYVNFDDGWQVGGAPLLTFDFNDYEHQLPIALGVQKTQIFDLGGGKKMPVRFGLEGRYHVARNDTLGSEWEVVFSISPILPNILSNWMNGCPTMTVGGC